MNAKLILEPKDESEYERLGELVQRIPEWFDGVNVEMSGPVDNGSEPSRSGQAGDDRAPIPTDELQAVYETVRLDPGRSRGKYHEKLVENENIWYDDPEDEDYEEREDLGEKMWDLERQGYLRHEGRRWYPA
jgi:hypothetical protein